MLVGDLLRTHPVDEEVSKKSGSGRKNRGKLKPDNVRTAHELSYKGSIVQGMNLQKMLFYVEKKK